MSQIEQNFRQFLGKRPDIRRCYLEGMINRRSLARYLVNEGMAKQNQVDATIAMLRRFDFGKLEKKDKLGFKDIKVNIKDNILILEYEKSKELMQKLQKLIAETNYDKGDTLKIVVGTAAIKIFIDRENEEKVKEVFKGHKLEKRFDKISEISIMFNSKATEQKGILSTVTAELMLNEIIITEMLTGAPELLIYLRDEYVLKAYSIIKSL